MSLLVRFQITTALEYFLSLSFYQQALRYIYIPFQGTIKIDSYITVAMMLLQHAFIVS